MTSLSDTNLGTRPATTMVGLPNTTAEIDPRCLNEFLPSDVRGGASITAVSAEVIGEGIGLLGEVGRLRLTYDAPTATSTTQMISKLPTANEGFRHIGSMLGLYEKEHRFYGEVGAVDGCRIPTAYANLTDGAGGYLLLLEDLAPLRPGDQLEGCTLEQARLALDAVARLHARWWRHPALVGFESWLPGIDSAYMQVLEGAYVNALPTFHDEWTHLVSPEVVPFADRVAERYRDNLSIAAFREPTTFIHGDFRVDNMMFGGPGETPFALLDFQLPFHANPMWDVVYFLSGSFTRDSRLAHQDELVRHYHSVLVANGVSDFSLEDCWEAYRRAAGVLIGYIVTLAGDIDLDTLNDRGRQLTTALFERYSSTIVDLGAMEFLE